LFIDSLPHSGGIPRHSIPSVRTVFVYRLPPPFWGHPSALNTVRKDGFCLSTPTPILGASLGTQTRPSAGFSFQVSSPAGDIPLPNGSPRRLLFISPWFWNCTNK